MKKLIEVQVANDSDEAMVTDSEREITAYLLWSEKQLLDSILNGFETRRSSRSLEYFIGYRIKCIALQQFYEKDVSYLG